MTKIDIGFKIRASIYVTPINAGTTFAIDVSDIKEVVNLADEVRCRVEGLDNFNLNVGTAIILNDDEKKPILVSETKKDIDDAIILAYRYKKEALDYIKKISNGEQN